MRRSQLLPTALLALLAPVLIGQESHAAAQTGVADDRVVLPDGPGSTEGLGDNAQLGGNQGALSYAVPVLTPEGYAGLTPSLGLSYSSSAGSGIVGMGWTLEVPSIERLTLRGLPAYSAEDEFAVQGAEQLVRVSGGHDAVYRARFERDFIRYTFHDAGADGYWEAELPDGSRGFFGATAAGEAVASARLAGDEGTFRYFLVERVDVDGHQLRYSYETVDGVPYLSRIAYGPSHEGGQRYEVALVYGQRPDEISDCKPGFEERITQRLTGIEIDVRGERVRRYALIYEDTEVAGGMSRLARVERYGRDGGLYPMVFSFGYGRALGGEICSAGSCEPHVVDMGRVPGGVTFHTGSTTLADLNADSLPDLIDTSRLGEPHRFFFSELGEGDNTHFAPEVASAVGTQSAFDIHLNNVQVLDVNGDGFTDLVNLRTSAALCNLGTGDWVVDGRCAVDGAQSLLPVAESSYADPNRFRFVDMDSDRRIDLLHTPSNASTVVYRNTVDGFVRLAGTEPLGRTFDVDRLVMSDVNADGLLDALHLGDTGRPSYRLNLGNGRWSPRFVPMDAPPLSGSALERVAFEDLNNDGRDDMVLVSAREVRFALNRNGQRFDSSARESDGGPSWGVLSQSEFPDLPVRGDGTTVLFADMNGNGTRDIVWIERTGEAKYLELFATPPNLLSRIENGLGAVQDVVYTTSISERRRSELAGEPAWKHALPMPMALVKQVDQWERLTGDENGVGLHNLTRYTYQDGYYDGVEKQFRGFVTRTVQLLPDEGDTQEGGREVERYDVGSEDPYYAGLLLKSEIFGGVAAEERALLRTESLHDDCPVAEVDADGLAFPVRHVCVTEEVQTIMEGRPQEEWRTQRSVMNHDGYGQVTYREDTGFLEQAGDEQVSEVKYVNPGPDTGGRWILGREFVRFESGHEGNALRKETRTYYDGAAFVGLQAGRLDVGKVTRVTEREKMDGSSVIAMVRRRFDAHGNVVEEITPRGAEQVADEHRLRFEYDEGGLLLRASEVALRTPEGEPYVLRRERSYDESFDLPAAATAWMVVQGGTPVTERNPTRVTYDEFAERSAQYQPGDPEDAPSLAFLREYGTPVTAIRQRARTQLGGALDMEVVQCYDGLGRLSHTRRRLDGNRYQVDGFSEYNSRGEVVRAYRPYLSSGSGCEQQPPLGVLHTTLRYDVLGRQLSVTHPDGVDHDGVPSVVRTRYLPCSVPELTIKKSAQLRGTRIALCTMLLNADDCAQSS